MTNIYLVEPQYNGVPYIQKAIELNVEPVLVRRRCLEVPEFCKELIEQGRCREILVESIDVPQLADAISNDESYVDSSGILAGNEFVVATVALVANILNKPSVQAKTAWICRDKRLMRIALRRYSPERVCIDALADHHFPIVMKPALGTGSFDVRIVKSRAAVDEYRQSADSHWMESRNSYDRRPGLIAERFISGPEYSVEMFWYENKCLFRSLTKKYKRGNEENFVERAHCCPAHVDETSRMRLLEFAETIASDAGVSIGPCHLELIDSGDGIYLVELAVRQPGDCIPILLQQALGVDLYAAGICSALAKSPERHLTPIMDKASAIIFSFTSAEHERLRKLNFVVQEHRNTGYREVVSNSFDRFGWVMLEHEKRDELQQIVVNSLPIRDRG